MAEAFLPELPDVAAGIDFREVPATREKKLWMINLVVNKTESAASLARRYHLSRKHLNKMVQRRLKGKAIESKCGRPRLLDDNSRASIHSEILNVTCTSIAQLKQSIDNEFKPTTARRSPNIDMASEDETEDPKMSRRSLKRFLFLLHPGVFPILAGDELNVG
jgi:hypothetical protein